MGVRKIKIYSYKKGRIGEINIDHKEKKKRTIKFLEISNITSKSF